VSELTITRPDDWHVHLRDGDALPRTAADMARYFGRIIVMPNLTPPVTTVDAAAAYRERILAAMQGLPRSCDPLMTLYLTDTTAAEEVRRAADSDFVHAVKLYPAGATTNSEAGVSALDALYPVLEVMQDCDLPLLVHGEVTDPEIDIFDREQVFIDRHLRPIVEQFPGLRVVLEHITTADAVDFVNDSPATVAATITAHHLLYDRNDMLVGGIRPHYYCLPILKRNRHQLALRQAATSGSPRFFLGTDSAPHARHTKEADCGCAGCYTGHAALELYATVFDSCGKLETLEGFASFFGADFYGLPRNSDTITLQRHAWQAPASLALGEGELVPLGAGQPIDWRVVGGAAA
jgi:dihydroorotase